MPGLAFGQGRFACARTFCFFFRQKRADFFRRIAVPADIVGPVLFLLGPDSAYMTGQTLWINGGAYMP